MTTDTRNALLEIAKELRGWRGHRGHHSDTLVAWAERIENALRTLGNAVMHAARCVYNSCYLKGWIGLHGGFYALTDAGRKALNDIRAAMGSALYKENES